MPACFFPREHIFGTKKYSFSRLLYRPIAIWMGVGIYSTQEQTLRQIVATPFNFLSAGGEQVRALPELAERCGDNQSL